MKGVCLTGSACDEVLFYVGIEAFKWNGKTLSKKQYDKKILKDIWTPKLKASLMEVKTFIEKSLMNNKAVVQLLDMLFMSIDFSKMNFEKILKMVDMPNGIVLVTGATGSGKSTTLASMIDYINRTRYDHIITIEDPIEFIHPHKRSVVSQRELGTNTLSFSNALRSALREDPDVILVGEMRDLETVSAACTMAETGHLVFGTLHPTDAAQTINRIIDMFPPHQQGQIRSQLSFVLRAVVAQQLLPVASGKGRVVSNEILIGNPAVANCIREQKVSGLYTVMQTSHEEGMMTFEMSLRDLYLRGDITLEEAMVHTMHPKELERMLKNG